MVCTSHLAFPRAMQAWAGVLHGMDCPGSTGRPDSSVFIATELMSAADSGLSIDDVWDKKYEGFFKASKCFPGWRGWGGAAVLAQSLHLLYVALSRTGRRRLQVLAASGAGAGS
jgi:hypothetical protein